MRNIDKIGTVSIFSNFYYDKKKFSIEKKLILW